MIQEAKLRGQDARRVAFFGGSFDPPHLGHLAVARTARAALRLDTVLFAPVGAQPLKAQGALASFEDRLAMTRLATAGEPAFKISLADAPIESGGPNYTLETLERLRMELGPEYNLFFLMGADSFWGLRNWYRAAEIPFAAPLIVASRPGLQLKSIAAALPPGLTMEAVTGSSESRGEMEVQEFLLTNQQGESVEFYLLPGLDIPVSASDIRDQLRAGAADAEAARAWLPAAVAEYVQTHRLYR
jgi:nicotinate-nucleotide adenylyltransferase